MTAEIVQTFRSFVRSEMSFYESDDNNRVAFSLMQIERYLNFLHLAQARHKSISDLILTLWRMDIESSKQESGSRILTPLEIKELEKRIERQTLLHYETESFFIFAKILLDKVAHFVEDYFGTVRSTSLKSHDKWCKQAQKYAQSKNLVISGRMLELMGALDKSVANYRDFKITHFQNPRALHFTVFNGEGDTQIGITAINPKPSDQQSTSPTVAKTAESIFEYICLVTELVQKNRSKSRYRLRTSSTGPE